jgi:hypothetical protein
MTIFFGFGMVQPAVPSWQGMPFAFATDDHFVRPAYNPLSFDMDNPGASKTQPKALAAVDTRDLALRPFCAEAAS